MRNDMVSVLAGQIDRYVNLKTPSEYVPFKGNFPLVKTYQMDEYLLDIRSNEKLNTCKDWVKDVILQGQQIYLIENGFIQYLKDDNIFDTFDKMKSNEKADILIKFMNKNNLGLERLQIN